MYDDYRQRGYEDVRQGAYGRARQPQYGERYENRPVSEDYSRSGSRQRHGDEPSGDFWDVLREAAHGHRPIPEELRLVIEDVVRDQTERMLAEQGYIPAEGSKGGHGSELHRRYKDVLEKLREIPSAMEAVKHFGKYFDDLSEEERKVLTQLIQRPTVKKQAAAAGVSPERFYEIKHELQYKLKEQ